MVFTLGTCPWRHQNADENTFEYLLSYLGWYREGMEIFKIPHSRGRSKYNVLFMKLVGGGAVSWYYDQGQKGFGDGKVVLAASPRNITSLGEQLGILPARPCQNQKREQP